MSCRNELSPPGDAGTLPGGVPAPVASTECDETISSCPHCNVAIVQGVRCCVFVPRAGAAPAITLQADARDPGGTCTWTAADPTVVQVVGAGASANVTGLRPGATDITVSYACPNGRQAQASIRCIAYQAEIEHPTGDPVANGSATNEFTFSAATPGVLSIACRARITPNTPEALACAGEHLRWSITAVGASALAWSSPDPANLAHGKGQASTASFTGLPAANGDFGAKTVTLALDGGAVIQTTTVEVFYPKTATNHPNPGQGVTPNWFFYWTQVIGSPAHVRYGGAGGGGNFGETLGMTQWSYGVVPDKTLVHIFDIAAGSDGAIAGLHGPLTGIDLFENTVLHETEHTQQIARADPVVGIHPGTCWANGWSWNTANHNHWRLGVGRVAGSPGICTSIGPGTMGSAGSGDSPLFAAVAGMPATYVSWPAAWGAAPAGAGPGGTFIGNTPIEQQAFQQEASAEHTRARQDWGDPGKNHRTLNRFND